MKTITQKVTRRGITVDGTEYWEDEMVLFHFGEKVNVEIDEQNITVKRLDGTSIATFIKQ